MAIRLYEEVMSPSQLKPDPNLGELLPKAERHSYRTDIVAGLSECNSIEFGLQLKHAI